MKLPEHVDTLRDLIEAAFDKYFARLGIGKTRQLAIESGFGSLYQNNNDLDKCGLVRGRI